MENVARFGDHVTALDAGSARQRHCRCTDIKLAVNRNNRSQERRAGGLGAAVSAWSIPLWNISNLEGAGDR